MKKAIPALCLVLLTFVLPSPIIPSSDAPTIPFSPYSSAPLGGVLFPRLGAPAFATSGSAVYVYVAGTFSGPWTGLMISPFDTYSPLVISSDAHDNITVVELSIPAEAKRGLYNLSLVDMSTMFPVVFEEPNCLYVVGPSFPVSIEVAVISDSHFGVGTYYDFTTKILRQTIDTLNALGPDVLVIPGDLVDGTTDPAAFEAVRAELMRLRIPAIIAQGNNDVVPLEKGLHFWEQYIAPDHFETSFGDYTFFVIQSDTGDVSADQLRWLDSSLASVTAHKVVVLHHPYWEETSSSMKVELPTILKTRGVDLVLMGHTHSDDVRTDPVLSIVTESISDSPAGYRLVRLSSSGVAYSLRSTPYDQLSVVHLQRNDFTSTGGSVLVKNDGPTDVDLRLLFRLRNPSGSSPSVLGGELSRAVTYRQGQAYVEVTCRCTASSSRLVSVYFEEDSSPPTVQVLGAFDGPTFVASVVPSDVGLGVLKADVFYSSDNSTWSPLNRSVLNRVEAYRLEDAPAHVYLKVVVEDAAGLSTTSYSVFTREGSAPAAEKGGFDLTLLVGLVLAISLAALFATFFLRRRR